MRNRSLRSTIDSIAWASFFIMLAVLMLMPEGRLPEDSWLIGMGGIILIANFIKYINGIKVDWFFIVVALLALAFGLDEYFGFELSFLPLIFIVIAISILHGLVFGKKCSSSWDCWDGDKKK